MLTLPTLPFYMTHFQYTRTPMNHKWCATQITKEALQKMWGKVQGGQILVGGEMLQI